VRKGEDLTTFIVPKVMKIQSLNLRIPKGPFRPVVGKLYLYLHSLRVSRFFVYRMDIFRVYMLAVGNKIFSSLLPLA
jgi:hypothetical protein